MKKLLVVFVVLIMALAFVVGCANDDTDLAQEALDELAAEIAELQRQLEEQHAAPEPEPEPEPEVELETETDDADDNEPPQIVDQGERAIPDGLHPVMAAFLSLEVEQDFTVEELEAFFGGTAFVPDPDWPATMEIHFDDGVIINFAVYTPGHSRYGFIQNAIRLIAPQSVFFNPELTLDPNGGQILSDADFRNMTENEVRALQIEIAGGVEGFPTTWGRRNGFVDNILIWNDGTNVMTWTAGGMRFGPLDPDRIFR